jgi:hypothetical protein
MAFIHTQGKPHAETVLMGRSASERLRLSNQVCFRLRELTEERTTSGWCQNRTHSLSSTSFRATT